MSVEKFSKDITLIRNAIDFGHEDDIINNHIAERLRNLVDEAESIRHTDSPALIRSRMRREQENLGWTTEDFFKNYNGAFTQDGSDTDKAITVIGIAIQDLVKDDISEEDFEDARNQFITSCHAAIFSSVNDFSELQAV